MKDYEPIVNEPSWHGPICHDFFPNFIKSGYGHTVVCNL